MLILVKLTFFLLAVAAFIGIALGVDWLIWCTWCWVMPQFWPTGPAAVIAPGFWLFVAASILLSLIGRRLSPSRK